MKGTLTRVLGAYPLAFPAVFSALAAMYPGTFSYDPATGYYAVQFTLAQMGAAAVGAYGLIGAVFGIWGIKK
jgi:hypothetical protein